MSNQEDAKEEDVSGSPSLPSLPLPVDPTSALTSSGKREPGDLPRELTCRPLGLVVLTGLDVTYNAVHRAIWDSFSANRRSDRVPLNFKILPGDHEYPKCRSKRTSYEWYIPKGIMKSNWMQKHLEEVPSLVVVFFDLDWDENLWKEKQMECATRVEVVRHSLSSRTTKVAVVLIQKNTPLPPGEDVVAAERAAALCASCELSAKSLFVLPCVDHLLGYTIRLENAFYELAQAYYHTEARRVKAHKEFLNKTTHQLLFVRHAFKVAFLNELKQEPGALKQYKAAYSALTDLRAHDTNMLEIKTIAGFINYKVCRLSFFQNAPLDAISQFRKHVDFFKNKIGCPELAFEHSAWMSKQFSIFGDLFDEAIKLGLTAIQTQHPGFYYQQAANHAIARKQLCRGLCHAATSMPEPNPLKEKDNLEFFGQRPWRQGHQSIDPPDAQTEKEGIQALQFLELQVDHSWIIIPLLSSAVAQFKKYKSARMKRYLMVQMGEEYYHAKDYSKALTLLGRVTWDYRLERWWQLLTSILITSLRCAYLVASIEDYVTISLELLGRYSQCSREEKTRIQVNLIRVMSNNAPEPEPGCAIEAVEAARQSWKDKVSAPPDTPLSFEVEMQNLVPFVECKGLFTSKAFSADSKVQLQVCLRSLGPFPIRFSKLTVFFSNPAYNQHCIVCDGHQLSTQGTVETETEEPLPDSQQGDLYLLPGQVKVHLFDFVALPEDVGKKLAIQSLSLCLGDENGRCAVLRWSGAGGDAMFLLNPLESISSRRGPLLDGQQDWNAIKIQAETDIVSRSSKVSISIDHEPPCLMSEIYHLRVKIRNQEEVPITQPSLSFGLAEAKSEKEKDESLEKTTQVSASLEELLKGECPPRITGIPLGTTKSGGEIVKDFYIQCSQLGKRAISAKVVYNVEVKLVDDQTPIGCTCHKDEIAMLETVTAFEVTIKLSSLKFQPIEHIHSDDPFILITHIKCCSPWPITIKDSTLQLSKSVFIPGDEPDSQVANISLKNNDAATECIGLKATPSTKNGLIPLGEYVLEWKRNSSNSDLPAIKSILPLPEVALKELSLYIDSTIPPFGSVRAQLPVVYTIYNKTTTVQSVEANVLPSDAFMLSGNKQVFFRILPKDCHTLSYNLYPLVPGYVKLPTMQLTLPQAPDISKETTQKMMPSHIFIKPQGKDIQ
ncbi:trafficking protein particle complex subunit 11-like isoform X2 [Apostichopus japonicus]|uniref:trafficking protein particle complex subunit 11-like isoform X1 n=1 Tax=Stichopus japonicus TaxID=307972 RepID=UPI003AB84CEC